MRAFITKKKWYAEPDLIYLSEVTDYPAPSDAFKRSRSIVRRSKIDPNLSQKPNLIIKQPDTRVTDISRN